MPLTPGTRLGPYEVLGALGAGGMGEVYRARHEKLRREVAIKVLPTTLASDRIGLARFEREARTASALNHPNIVTIHDIARHDGITYIAMELVEGRVLADLIGEGPLPMDRVLAIATQVVEGLARAHDAGIVHRDIKPANVMVTADGLVKILDFGLAKPLAGADRDERTHAMFTTTGQGLIAGTPHYMSPEQWSGGPVDHRCDQFAFGVLLYEAMCGRRPFDGPSLGAMMTAVLTQPTPPLRGLRADAPADLERIVTRCLEKEPGKRFGSSAELAAALRACAYRRARAEHNLAARIRRPVVAIPAAVVLLAALAVGGVWVQGAERRWAENEAIEEITALVESGGIFEAYRTGLMAARYLGEDPELGKVMQRVSFTMPVNTVPEGADVAVRGYGTPHAPWEPIGTTPLNMAVPYAMMRWRITKEGYEPFEGAPFGGGSIGALSAGLVLDSVGGRPPGTVRVAAGVLTAILGLRPPGEAPLARLDPYFLDRYEVTNRQYREFVDAGGYADPAWWPSAIQRDGEAVAWEDAVADFVDATGRPGPAGWELARYPAGRDDFPVTGISWFEAAAYCAFAGKALPTVYHWFHAVGQQQRSEILAHSNLGGEGLAPVGRFQGLAAYGTYDMAGNAKEWAWNASGELRYLLGGAWSEPNYVFLHPLAQDGWDRSAANGVRCAFYPETPPASLTAPVTPDRTYPTPEPVDARGFALIRSMYAYARDSLDARVEGVNDSLTDYRRETVSFRTAYADGRMEVHLLIPRDAAPPYQSVIWMPGGDVYTLRSSEGLSSSYLVDFLPRTGRVLVQPVFEGMYERFDGPPRWDSPIYFRDLVVRWAQDLGRTIDYLETRPDFDLDRIAYYGFSGGANFGPVFDAVEPRLAASILLGGGLIRVPFRTEGHPVTFAPWARTPTLMINGRDDFMLPYDESQRPLFEMLGAPEADKRHVRLDGGHIPSHRHEIVREVLNWLDERFGPVRARSNGRRTAGSGGAP